VKAARQPARQTDSTNPHPDTIAARGSPATSALDVFMLVSLLSILGVAAALVLWLIAVYNSLVKLRNMKDEAWSGIDVQLKRRSDLIPTCLSRSRDIWATSVPCWNRSPACGRKR